MKKTKLKIRLDGDPCLRIKSEPVKSVGAVERMILESMLDTMYEAEGVGLAAPQVGINKRMFVLDTGEGPLCVINPQVLGREGSCKIEEGCLSVPEVAINIERPQKIKVSFLNENNELVNAEFIDLAARAFLHECDHLDGKLILDYASKAEIAQFEEQLNKMHEIQKEK